MRRQCKVHSSDHTKALWGPMLELQGSPPLHSLPPADTHTGTEIPSQAPTHPYSSTCIHVDPAVPHHFRHYLCVSIPSCFVKRSGTILQGEGGQGDVTGKGCAGAVRGSIQAGDRHRAGVYKGLLRHK